MGLITNIKKIRLYNCRKHQKQINLLSKLLVFLLAINYTSSAVSGSPKTTYDRGLLTDSASATAALNTKNYKFNKKGYCFFSHNIRHGTITGIVNGLSITSADDLKNGKIAIDATTLKIDTTKKTGFNVYDTKALDCQQQVNNIYVYEYISNHQGTGAIGEDSSIYFGLTPAKATSGNAYHLAAFDYLSYNDGTHNQPALNLNVNTLKTKLASNKLTSIVICSTLDANVWYHIAPLVHQRDALYIIGDSTITLTDGLIIAKSAHLKVFDKIAMNLDCSAGNSILKADIINYGIIEGNYGVVIGKKGFSDDGTKSNFCLLPPNSGTTAKFINHGTVEAHKGHAFKIMGKKSDKVKTFELTNESDGYIFGSSFLVETASSVNFNVINYGIIDAGADNEPFNTTNYIGKPSSILCFHFHDGKIKKPIAHFSDSLTLEADAKIMLYIDTNKNTNKNIFTKSGTLVTIAEASNNIKLDQKIDDLLVIPLPRGSFTPKFIIEATAVKTTNKKITAILESKQTPPLPAKDKGGEYLPDMIKAVNALDNIKQAIKGAVAFKNLKVDIAGIDFKKELPQFKKSTIFKVAKNHIASINTFSDILLPDSSNSQLICNHVIATKLANQINARINSKSMVAIKAKSKHKKINNQGITSGEVIANISVWTAFNYFRSNSKSNNKKQNYSQLKAMTFSLGTDSQLEYKDTVIGLSYGFCSSNNKNYGGSSGKQVSKLVAGISDEEDLKTHTVTLYSAMTIQPIDIQAVFSFGSTKHIPKASNYKDYNTSIIGMNFATIYPLVITKFNIDFTGSLGVNIINTEKYTNKYRTQIKADNKSLVLLSLVIAINDTIEINDNIELDYKFGIGGKYTISDDKKSSIYVTQKASIDYNKRRVIPFNFNLDANLNLQIYKNIHLGLNLDFGMGKDSTEYGAASSVRYIF